MSSIKTNPDETHIFAILYPAKGKLERLKELMAAHIDATHANEEYTPRYFMTEQLDAEEPALHCFETYVNREGADKHTKTDNFKVLMDACEKEGIWGREPYLVFTRTVGGYDWDRVKV